MSRSIFLVVASLAITMSIGFSGCCSRGGSGCGGMLGGYLDSYMQEQVACMQEKVWAKRAFHLRYGHCERIHADHFKDGFIAGYRNVSDGNGGEIPALPPEKYWGFQYRNQEGSEMQDAWFAGYENGAGSARTDGSGSFHEIQISRQLERAMLDAQQVDNIHAGIEKEYVVDMAPVRKGTTQTSQPETAYFPQVIPPVIPQAIPQANRPYIPDQIPATDSTSSNFPSVPNANSVPGTPTGFDLNQPLPESIVPTVPDTRN